MADGDDPASKSLQEIGAEAVRRRWAIHLNQETWDQLRTLSRDCNLTMASLVRFLVFERSAEQLMDAIQRNPHAQIPRGRRKKSYYSSSDN